jgi:hypothetical protein
MRKFAAGYCPAKIAGDLANGGRGSVGSIITVLPSLGSAFEADILASEAESCLT